MSAILVEHGKHGDFYWDASTPEAVTAAALTILIDRWNTGYHYDEPESEPERPATLPSVEEIKAIKDEDIRRVASKKHNRWKAEVRNNRIEREEYNLIKKAIEEKDGGLAWQCLQNRSDYEYELVSHEPLQKA